MVGAVSLRDLLRVFLRPDNAIRTDIINEVLAGYLGTNPAMVRVDVTDGVVKLSGEVERRSMLPLVLPMVRAVDGVIDAECELRYAVDDTGLPTTADMTDY
jgi:osmotically-inducible protein OsmY